MKKFALSALIALAATSAYAQTTVATEYYVVRDEATKKCTIVDKKPTTTTTIVDNGVFKTRTAADRHEDHEGLYYELKPKQTLEGPPGDVSGPSFFPRDPCRCRQQGFLVA